MSSVKDEHGQGASAHLEDECPLPLQAEAVGRPKLNGEAARLRPRRFHEPEAEGAELSEQLAAQVLPIEMAHHMRQQVSHSNVHRSNHRV